MGAIAGLIQPVPRTVAMPMQVEQIGVKQWHNGEKVGKGATRFGIMADGGQWL